MNSPLTPPGVNDFAEQANNPKPWYQRWYVWVLPALVIFGVVVGVLSTKP